MNLTAQRFLEAHERHEQQGTYNVAITLLYDAARALNVNLDWSDARGTWRVEKDGDERFFRTTWETCQMLWDYSNREASR